jgi:hypothetical protein
MIIKEVDVHSVGSKVLVEFSYQLNTKVERFLVVGTVRIGDKKKLLLNVHDESITIADLESGKVSLTGKFTGGTGYETRTSGSSNVLAFSFESKAAGVYDIAGKNGSLTLTVFQEEAPAAAGSSAGPPFAPASSGRTGDAAAPSASKQPLATAVRDAITF